MTRIASQMSPGEPLRELTDVDLFAGAGGLSLGLKRAGFGPSSLFEYDGLSCETLRHNNAKSRLFQNVVEVDLTQFHWLEEMGPVRLLAAGAPCQPFSLGGRHKAERDGRNLFPEVLRAVRALKPRAVMLENVKGLLRASFRPYFEYVLRQLEIPSIEPKHGELWQGHDARLRQHQCSVGYQPEYKVAFRLVDAADYGVPQSRQRVFVVATLLGGVEYMFPRATHSRQALRARQLSGEYWNEHGLKPPKQLSENGRLQLDDGLRPWQTVRDALYDLPIPSRHEDRAWMNHWSIPGARTYTGHVGSVLDLPSKTIKAGVHGVPGGENILVEDSGRVRYLTLRELARLQTFPDDYFFVGARIHVTRQVGNAVPCALATAMARPLLLALSRPSREHAR